jgi:tRNA A-37 threonylcarbamoyl transferase component Bud32
MPTCKQCEKPFAENAPEGLCPSCLAIVALDIESPGQPAGKGRSCEPGATISIGPEAFTRVRYFGDYELQQEIAHGGMGVVWKARQASLNRTVALKMILAGKLASETEVLRFRREAEAAANLQHPNIVAIHEVGEHDGQHYYSMDYVDGRDLGAWVRQNGPMPPARAAECLKTIAEAVHFAHQRGTLHRDLKPQNVLMDSSVVPRITDFGLAKFVERDDSLTQSGTPMGSPSYMPPEQAAGHLDQVGPHSDVYSLGAILYELLTGRPPFRAETAMATMRQVMESEPVALRKVNPAVPPDLETICLKCLEKNPVRRYPSANALAEDLARFLKHEPIQALRPTAFRKAESWLRRHPWTLMWVASFIVMVLACMFYWEYQRVKLLEYLQSHPGQAPRPSGGAEEGATNWATINLLALVVNYYTLRLYRNFKRGVHWNKLLYASIAPGSERPANPLLCFVCALMGIAGTGVAMFYIARIIHASVWDYSHDLFAWLLAYSSFNFSLQLVSGVVRDYQKFVHGAPSRILSAEKSELIRQAIFDGKLPRAAKLYRQAFPDVAEHEAGDFVARLAAELKDKHPHEFMPPSKFWDLNWRAIRICSTVELGVLAILWLFVPSFTAARWPVKLLASAVGFIVGAGCSLPLRLKRLETGILLMLLCLLPGLIAGSLYFGHAGSIYCEGVAFGACIIMCGSIRKRRKYTPGNRLAGESLSSL